MNWTYAPLVACCLVGAAISAVALYGEHRKWPSQADFSVATKVPVELLCITGPIVLVSFTLYLLLAYLIVTCHDSASMKPVFYISTGWTMVYLDMCVTMYKNKSEIFTQRFDMSLHTVNFSLAILSYIFIDIFPWAFAMCAGGFWASIIVARVYRKYRLTRRPRLPSRELQRPGR